MNIDAALKAGAQIAKGRQPGMGALDHPAVTPEPVIALDTPAGNAILGTSALEVDTTSCVVVSYIADKWL